MRLAQWRIPCCTNDQAVYLAVDGEIVVELAVPVVALHARLQEAQALQFAFGDTLSREFSRKPLDACERFEKFEYAICLDIGNPRAAVRS